MAEPSLARGSWLLVLLVGLRAGVVLGLELAHHGKIALAGLRLAHALPGIVLGGLGLVLLGCVVARLAAAAGRSARLLAFLSIASPSILFLWGLLDADRSRRIGARTTLGSVALALTALAALALAFLATRPRRSAAPRRGAGLTVLLPLLLLVLGFFGLRAAFGGMSANMRVDTLEEELLTGTWEVLREYPDHPPEPGVLCPSAEYSPEGAARPALVLPPPARVRRILPESGTGLWLTGAAGLDHSTASVLRERYPGHALRLRVSADGALASEARLALDARAWVEFGAGEGLAVASGARIELESALIDAQGNEVQPDRPLQAGFGGLLLERRAPVARARATPEQPNLVLVLLDTLRADRTSAYGYARATTPHLEGLAERGVRFDDISATASWTWPSTASILTGLYPHEHGVEDAASSFLSERLDTLAEALQRVGVTTAAWSGSPLIVPAKGFDQGFEWFDASREGRLRRSDIVLPAALEWLASAGDRRFFLYLHLMEPHAPYVPLEEGRRLFAAEVPRGFDPRKTVDYSWELQREGFTPAGEPRTTEVVSPEEQAWIHALYDGCVWSADHYVGLLLARLEELGLTENTIVAVTSDHGEELFERGLLSHGHSLHRELVRVPLILAGPGLPVGTRVSTPLSAAAIGPTLARLGGAPLADRGRSARAALDLFTPRGQATEFYSTRQGWWNGVAWQPIFGLRRGAEVLHFAPRGLPWGASGAEEAGEIRLYDHEADPEEQRDLASREPARAAALRDELVRVLAASEARRLERAGGEAGTPDAGTLELMRGLGYVGE